jgi:hypothetical protein
MEYVDGLLPYKYCGEFHAGPSGALQMVILATGDDTISLSLLGFMKWGENKTLLYGVRNVSLVMSSSFYPAYTSQHSPSPSSSP